MMRDMSRLLIFFNKAHRNVQIMLSKVSIDVNVVVNEVMEVAEVLEGMKTLICIKFIKRGRG